MRSWTITARVNSSGYYTRIDRIWFRTPLFVLIRRALDRIPENASISKIQERVYDIQVRVSNALSKQAKLTGTSSTTGINWNRILG